MAPNTGNAFGNVLLNPLANTGNDSGSDSSSDSSSDSGSDSGNPFANTGNAFGNIIANPFARYPTAAEMGFGVNQPKDKQKDEPKGDTKVPTADFSLADKTLLDSGLFSDAKIVANGKTYNVHKNILCSRSKWFRAAFDGGFREGNTSVIDISAPDNIGRLLEFLYTGAVDLNSQARCKTMAAANELSVLGDFYQVDALKKYAKQVLGNYLGKHLVAISPPHEEGLLPVEYLTPLAILEHKDHNSGAENYKIMKEAGFPDRLCAAIRAAYATPSGIHRVYVAFVCAARAQTFRCQLIRGLRGEIAEFGDDLLTAMMDGLSCSALEGNVAFEMWKDTLSLEFKPKIMMNIPPPPGAL